MILVSINGNCLRINPENPEDMLADIVAKDVVTLTASPVINCKEFRKEVLEKVPADDPDPKQKTIDKVMEILENLHNEVESKRK